MAVPGPTIRRLMKEVEELSESSPSPSPYFHAHPISDSNLFDWHFTLFGPPAPSPYANGIYHGRIVLSPQYPLRPPSFRFLTPSGRFEVNREICLSISGHHDETWQPAWGIRTALTAIRSFMDGDVKGQVGGLEAKEEVRRDWAQRSRQWKCDVCPGQKTNEEILQDWWEVCKAKGVAVGDQEDKAMATDTTLPDGLVLSYRDEPGKNQGSGSHPTADNQSSDVQNDTQPQRDQAVESMEEPSITIPTIPTRSSPAATCEPQYRSRPPRPPSIANADVGDRWLDRAIFGIIIALVLMILRKIYFADSIDDTSHTGSLP
ncbi:hypothetical protein LOZ39_005159 [Ophidiomyces ophidiicola]|nr:hypothetical protein LOZ50_005043 [Ophidiomyces ophidiicola]KAI2008759.1 hypothetical protein LOZ49_004168 [Ophidiomyces ophidiicola]KAI2070025.1 hypothetical protein LOZ39_005159 [Ophidiomyces ophidiicola]KAI2133370.1 hypothetical protein LOZ28_005460 [Ophidiomyces ophidiicola]KAI2138213.1 hypothetical protein LOZ29_002934 [Ophidiomyces ophidiicola]